jgi:preprotein translocase subunit SecG
MVHPMVLASWWSEFFISILSVLFVFVALLLIGVILIQRGRGGGLVGAFSGLGNQALGTKAGDTMTWVTVVLAGVFLVIAMLLTRSVGMEELAKKSPEPTPTAPLRAPAGDEAPQS